jgi:predicted SprT family Zn-dependent metalloprotease
MQHRRVQGIEIVPKKRLPGQDLTTNQAEFNTALSKIRAAVEHAIAHLKTWRMLSEEGGRYRAPIEKYQSMLKAVIGLYFFAVCE